MIQWNAFPFIRFTISLIGGILLYITFKFPIPNHFYILGIGSALYLIVYLFNLQYKHKLQSFLGGIAIFLTTLFGYILSQSYDASGKADHISHFSDYQFYQGKIIADPEEKDRTYKAEFSIEQIKTKEGWIPVNGKILLYINKSQKQQLHYGDVLLVKGKVAPLEEPKNPDEFNYKRYLSFQNIYHVHYSNPKNIRLLKNDPPNILLNAAIKLRKKFDALLRKNITGNEEYKIASALILGIRNTLDNDIKAAYTNTGTMHVLAVSGLHVAIIFQMLSLFFGGIKKIKYGNILFCLLILVLLWFYAFLSGLSASVLRAVAMFSFIIVAKAINRNTNIYNTLALSAFLLLCWNPYMIMDVGFQLSYLAVLGIVYLYPILYHSIYFSSWLGDKTWSVSCVSIAAQLATFPIGLLYFHQFPNYFLLSNLLVIPLSSGILYTGIALMTLGWIPLFGKALGWLVEILIGLLNKIVFIMEDIPFSVVGGIDVSILETCLIYLLLFALILFLKKFQLNYFGLAFGILCFLCSFQIIELYQQHQQNKFIVYHIPNHSAMAFIKGREAILLADSGLIKNKNKLLYHSQQYLWKTGVDKTEIMTFKNMVNSEKIHSSSFGDFFIIYFEGKKIIYADRNLSRKLIADKNNRVDYIVCSNKAFKGIKSYVNSFNLKHIIFDSSIKKSWGKEKEILSLNLPYCNVPDKGAFVSDL